MNIKCNDSIPYHVGADANDCATALQNVISCLERDELDGADYFLRLASHHLNGLKREVTLRRRYR